MKILSAVVSLLAVSGALAADSCYQDVTIDCGQASSTITLPSCNSFYGGYQNSPSAAELQAYATLHLERSYEYLLSAAYFTNYQTNRAGFGKLFRKLSDDAWEKTVDIIKHVTMRGAEMDFAQKSSQKGDKKVMVELRELEAMAKLLDTQKEIAERAFYIHREATRNRPQVYDPEIAQYMEEEFIEGQAKRIREVAGYTTNLKTFTNNNGQDLALALYQFDEFLKEVV